MEQIDARVKIPRDVNKILLTDEQVLLAVKQSRWKVLFNPDTIVVTSQRVIRYSPSGFLGIHKDIEDYRYEDMANFKSAGGCFSPQSPSAIGSIARVLFWIISPRVR